MLKNFVENKIIGLVGNASLILEKNYSTHIDDNDTVLRFNRGIPTHPYQGKKFDILCCSGKPIIEDLLDQIPPNVIILYGKDLQNKYLQQLREKLNLVTKKQKASTGLLFLTHVISLKPKQINLYGFDWNKTKTYYEEEYRKRTDLVWTSHIYDNEERLIRDEYCKKYNIRIFE